MVSAPQSDAGGLTTDQRLCGFYIAWFFKCYESNDSGWWPRRTPDGLSVGDQDAYFWRALETIAQTMMLMRAEEMARQNMRG
jgi:hypothetical protein